MKELVYLWLPMRFAYIILAHDNFKLLQKLVSSIDDPRNDIYIHFDKKVKVIPSLTATSSNLIILRNRTDIRWGTVSLLEVTFNVFSEVSGNGPYDYYHLISGTHLPLKSQDDIHNHFSSAAGASVLRLWEPDEGDADFKLRRIHWGISNFQSKNPRLRFIVQRFWTLNLFIQKKLGIRINTGLSFIKSDAWVSVTQEAVDFLVGHRKKILKRYRYAFCGDEYFIATELRNGGIKFIDDKNLLYVSFEKDHPKKLDRKDFDDLSKTEYLFARKFDDSMAF